MRALSSACPGADFTIPGDGIPVIHPAFFPLATGEALAGPALVPTGAGEW
ncbi:hypothetical protein [Nonomuraea longispora]|nr:hypothetical protein [Nonomuraea longispora]